MVRGRLAALNWVDPGQPPASFPLSAAWTVIAAHLPEETWGAIMQPSPARACSASASMGRSERSHSRAATAVMACALWFEFVVSIWQAMVAVAAGSERFIAESKGDPKPFVSSADTDRIIPATQRQYRVCAAHH